MTLLQKINLAGSKTAVLDMQVLRTSHINKESQRFVQCNTEHVLGSICSTGRTAEQFKKEGTGSMLAIQTGSSASSLMRIPRDESKVVSTTKFVQGKCFYMMGMVFVNCDRYMFILG